MSLFLGMEKRIEEKYYKNGELENRIELIKDFEELISCINDVRKNNGEKFITFYEVEQNLYHLTDEALSKDIVKVPIYVLPDFYLFYEFMYANYL